jgi:hypothetical protein
MKMGWHVHFKNGKYNIWSTVVDDYILKEWVDPKIIIAAYVEKAAEDAAKDAIELIKLATENKGCSVRFKNFQCDKI